MSFVVPVVVDNAEGWGPVGQPDNLFDAPFAPFNKSDKLGKAADWLQTNRPCIISRLTLRQAPILQSRQGCQLRFRLQTGG